MATRRTYMTPQGRVVTFNQNRTAMYPSGAVVSEQLIAPPSGGRIMSSLAAMGGLAGHGGIAGIGGGLAG